MKWLLIVITFLFAREADSAYFLKHEIGGRPYYKEVSYATIQGMEKIPQVVDSNLLPVKFAPKFVKRAEASELTPKESLIAYAEAMANKYKIDPIVFKKVIQCESGWNPKAWNKKDPHGGAKGIMQFLTPTFLLFEKDFGKDLDIWNAEDQLELGAWAFSTGKARHWSCYNKIR